MSDTAWFTRRSGETSTAWRRTVPCEPIRVESSRGPVFTIASTRTWIGFWSLSRWMISNACATMRTAISFLPLLRPFIIRLHASSAQGVQVAALGRGSVPVDEALDDRHLRLLELALRVAAGGVREVDGMADLDVVRERDVLDLDAARVSPGGMRAGAGAARTPGSPTSRTASPPRRASRSPSGGRWPSCVRGAWARRRRRRRGGGGRKQRTVQFLLGSSRASLLPDRHQPHSVLLHRTHCKSPVSLAWGGFPITR
jgi:hypothetical protein